MSLQYSENLPPDVPRGGGQYMANQAGEDVSMAQGDFIPPQSNSASQGDSTTTSRASHQCPLCPRLYERADHLSRHMKTHENARPHKCTQCAKRFNRADLLSRHEANHGRIPGKRGEESDRVSVACRACVASKCKCQDQKPCVRCRTKGIACEVGPLLVRGEPAKRRQRQSFSTISHDNNPYTNDQSRPVPALTEGDESLSNQNQSSRSPEIERMQSVHDNQVFLDSIGSVQLPFHQHSNSEVLSEADTAYGTLGIGSLPINNAPQLYGQSYQPYPSVPGDFQFDQLGFVPRESYFGQDLDFDMWDMDHADFEMHLPLEVPPPPPVNSTGTQAHQDPHVTNNVHAYKRFAAFEKSPWLWIPTSNDHALNDQPSLNVDTEGVDLASTPVTPGTQMEQFSSCSIDAKMRDRILHLLFNLRVAHTPVTTFPPLSLLNIIIQVYFVQCQFSGEHMIHAASFNSQTVLPELLLAIIAAGATSISAPSIWRMGLVLQELVRHTVSELWERNNSKTRSLQAIQAWIMGIEVGLWSGVKRKMEIAESLCQPAIMMTRRAGVFSMGTISKDLIPTMDDSTPILEAKWKKFVERESFKRLALRIFIHDVQASVGFQKPPQMSFTELEFDLPVSRDLWLAESALRWRDIYLEKQWVAIPTFLEAVQNPEILHQVASLIDGKVSAMIVIGGHWGQIWRLMEAKKFYPSTKAAYRLSMMTEQDELYRGLVSGVASMSSLCRNEPAVVLFGEFFLMVSHVSPETIQRFAGKSGAEDSGKAHEAFRNWFHTSDSRMAIWHAGQVLRAAKSLLPTQLKDFYAVAVYYASLTLWIYGIMLLAKEESHPETIFNHQGSSSTQIYLNEPETVHVNTFRVVNQGQPGLTMTDDDQVVHFVPITSASRVLEFAKNIYRNNFPHLDKDLPPLLESLGNLMTELSSVPGSRASRTATEAIS